MSTITKTNPASAKGNGTQAVLDSIQKLQEGLTTITTEVAELKKPAYQKGLHPADLFHATTGPVGKDSEGYSILKALAYCNGYTAAENVKYEIDVHKKLGESYAKLGYKAVFGRNGFMLPYASGHLPYDTSENERLAVEVREKVKAGNSRGYDPDEAEWIMKQMGPGPKANYWKKALGTVSDAAGGTLVGFPTLGELVDLQRNLEAFPKAGSTETTLPPNGRLQYPKLTGGCTAYWVGEATAITTSNQSTGDLDLQAKKVGILVPINNELLRFANPTAETMVRLDMARQGALFLDLGMLEGTGGTQIKGLLNYDTQSSWTQGNDKVILLTATTTGSNGDTFDPEDVSRMHYALPDAVEAPTAWLWRKSFFSAIMNRRADAAAAGDKKGPFMFWTARGTAAERPPEELYGTKVITTSQVKANRTKGNSSVLTYVVLGYFPDWIIARFGVMEFLMTNVSDTAITNDQSILRGVQHVDAGARHAASFCIIDTLLTS